MRQILKYAGIAIITVLAIDALGFIAWVASGQYPADGCYVGSITAHILRAIIY